MSYLIKDVKGKDVNIFISGRPESTVRLRGSDGAIIKLPLRELGDLMIYALTNWVGELPAEVVTTLTALSRMFTVVPVTSLPDPRNSEG